MPLFIFAVIVFLLILLQALFIVKRYVKVPPNRLLVIYGKVSADRACVVKKSGGAFIWPVIQDYCWLSTEPFTVAFPNGDKLVLRISRDEPLVDRAAEQLLGLRQEEIDNVVRDHVLQAGPSTNLDKTLAKIGLVRSDS